MDSIEWKVRIDGECEEHILARDDDDIQDKILDLVAAGDYDDGNVVVVRYGILDADRLDDNRIDVLVTGGLVEVL